MAARFHITFPQIASYDAMLGGMVGRGLSLSAGGATAGVLLPTGLVPDARTANTTALVQREAG